MLLNEPFQKRIDAARGVMLLGVILIHCNILTVMGADDPTLLVDDVATFFSIALPSCCVPWFFMISAYLNGLKYKDFTWNSYLRLLKKRGMSIVVPYLLWNTLALVFWQAINLTFLSRYTSGGYQFTTFPQLLSDVYLSPILEPLWFLRNLTIFIILLPVLQKILQKSGIIFLLIVIFADNLSYLGGILYYGIGLMLAKYVSEDRLLSVFKYSGYSVAVYLLVNLSGVLFYRELFEIPVMDKLLILVGVFGFWGIAPVSDHGRFRISRSAVFFIYAFHGIISPYALKGFGMFGWQGNYWLLDYVVVYLSVVAVSYLVYVSTKRLLPGFCGLLSGRR